MVPITRASEARDPGRDHFDASDGALDHLGGTSACGRFESQGGLLSDMVVDLQAMGAAK